MRSKKNAKLNGEVWSVKTSSIAQYDSLALIYEKEENDYIFQMLLCDQDADVLTDMDIVIPKENSDLGFRLKVESDAVFPMLEDSFKNYIGKIDEEAMKQVKLLKNSSELIDIELEIGEPILFKSDNRYVGKIKELSIINHLSAPVMEKIIGIESNIIFIIEHKKKNEFDSIRSHKDAEELIPLLERELARIVPHANQSSLKIELVAA